MTFTIPYNDGKLQLGECTRIMGVINMTPDSFSHDGFFDGIDRAIQYADKMIKDGADIIDVGGESTRPGARDVTEEEESRRVIPLIKELSKMIDRPISIDTRKAGVADRAIAAGARIINDVSGLRGDKDMVRVAATNNVPVVIMHMRGSPQDMQRDPVYNDVVNDIINFLREGIELAISGGIDEDNIIIDPGIGFGKTVWHNLAILRRLKEFKCLGRPILIGPSRKSFIGRILKKPMVEDRLFGTMATVAIAISNGADIVRVHDVKEAAEVAKVSDAIRMGRYGQFHGDIL